MLHLVPGPANPIEALTDYELRNLVAHLAEARRLGDLRRLLTLETAPGLNAWYEARRSGGAVGAYVLDVTTALRAVQELSANRLGDEYRYALLLTSLNSLAATVPASLLLAMVQSKLLSTTDALSYARRATEAIQRAESLIRLLPSLEESELEGVFDEILREVEASGPEVALAEQSKGAKLLASAVPHLPAAEQARVVDELIGLLEGADESSEQAYPYVDAVSEVARYLSPAQAERLFELSSRSADELVRDDLLP